MGKLGRKFWLIVLSGLLMIQLVVLTFYFRDQRYLEDLADRIVPASLLPSEQVKQILAFLRAKPGYTSNSYFLFPALGFLRPTARQVAEQGGDCADRSRLLVVLMRFRGIRASKWALYSGDPQPRHAVVEVRVETGNMVVDPLYGLWFPRPEGGFYGIRDLKENPGILSARIRCLVSRGERPGTLPLEKYPIDDYTYEHFRSVNWSKSAGMRLIYALLHELMGERVDEIPRPGLAEQPALMVAVAVVPLEGVALVLWLLAVGRRRTVRSGQSLISEAKSRP